MFGFVSRKRYEAMKRRCEHYRGMWLEGNQMLEELHEAVRTALPIWAKHKADLAAAHARIAELTQPRDAKGHFVSRKAAVMDEIQGRDCSFIERNG